MRKPVGQYLISTAKLYTVKLSPPGRLDKLDVVAVIAIETKQTLLSCNNMVKNVV